PLQGFHLAPVAFPRCLRNPYLHSSDVSFHAVPVELVPGGDNAEGRRRAAINALSHAILLSGLTGEGTSALAAAAPTGPISCSCPSAALGTPLPLLARRRASSAERPDGSGHSSRSRVRLTPVSAPLQRGLRFLHPPLPAPPTACEGRAVMAR